MDAIERGAESKSVLNNAAFNEAVTAMKADIITSWSRNTAPVGGLQEREKLHMKMLLLNELEDKLRMMIDTAERATKAAQNRQNLSKVRRL